MKTQLLTLLTGLALITGTPSWAGTNVTVQVKGMVCDLCARGLTKGFGAKTALEHFKVELAKHTVSLTVKDGATITDAEITQVVEDSSLAVDKIIR